MIDPAASEDARTDFADTFRVIDPSAPALSVGELSTQRGDGIFESIGVVDGHAQETQAHLDRLAHSARLCDLPAPNLEQWRAAVRRCRAARAAPRRGRHQAHPESRRRARPRADGVGDGGGRRRQHRRARARHPRRHARSRLWHRHARAGAVAAARREDALVRGQHGGDPRGEAPWSGRRDLRLLGRLRARSADRIRHPAVRRPLRHTGAQRRHPPRHDAAEPVRPSRGARARDRLRDDSDQRAGGRRMPRGWCRASVSPRRSPRSTAPRSRSTPSSRHPSIATC